MSALFSLCSLNFITIVLVLTFCQTISCENHTVTHSPVTTDSVMEDDILNILDGNSEEDSDVSIEHDTLSYLHLFINQGGCFSNSSDQSSYYGQILNNGGYSQCVQSVLRLGGVNSTHSPSDQCAGRFCSQCENEGYRKRNCHTCCCNESIILTRRRTKQEEINNDCSFLDLPTCATGISRCEALKRLINMSSPCSSAVTRGIVDDCTKELTNNSTGDNQCDEFPLFPDSNLQDDDNTEDFVDEFCSRSRMHSTMCGAFCRKDSQQLQPECESRKSDFCIFFVRTKDAPENEEEDELISSSLLNVAQDVDIKTIGICINRLISAIKSRNSRLTDQMALNILDTIDVVFSESSMDRWMNLDNISSTSNAMFNIMNNTVGLMIDSLLNFTGGQWIYRANNMVMDVLRFRRNINTTFSFPNGNEVQNQNSSLLNEVNVSIPFTSSCNVTGDMDGCFVTIAISVIDNFASYINQGSINRTNCPGSRNIRESGSSLLSVVVKNSVKEFTQFLEEPVKIQFAPKGAFNVSSNTYQAYFLDSQFCWNDSGLSTTLLSNGVLEVVSNHLTSFAILVSPTGEVPFTKSSGEGRALELVTYIGCSISIVCLSLTLLVLILFREKLQKGVLLYIHINLTLSLLLAMVVFVTGVDHATFNKKLCVFVAALVQYLFLCAFFWMWGEGVMLYLLIVRVFGNASKRWYLLLPICWGVPAVIVAISAGSLHKDYIANNGTICWINAKPFKPAIWTFLVPMILIACVNTVIFIMTLISIAKTRDVGSSEWKRTRKGLLKMMIKSTLVLLPLLGVTWVLGLFAVVKNTSTFAWIFTILNSLQGLFIFLMHIVRNDYLMAETRKRFTGMRRSRKASTISVKSADTNKTVDPGFPNKFHQRNSSLKLTQ